MTDNARKWLQAAPLPALILGAYVYAYAIDDKVAGAQKDAAVAAEQAKQAAETAKGMDAKLDKLLEAVLELKAQKQAEEKAKKEKK